MDNTEDEQIQLEGQISYEAFLYNKRKQNKNEKSSILKGQMSFDDLISEHSENKLKVKNREQKVSNKSDNQNNGVIFDKSISEVIHNSMIPYTEYVVMDRALPRVEDGLKPVQRRILYSMLELGLTPEKQYRKSARIVGDCMGKYHPHGDSSVYDAMVRMAQDYSLRETLVDGHGNFGSIDGDSPAAMRYTEAKLTNLALELLKDLHRDTVSWSFNFDDTIKEPDMLPGKFPNLLVNGATGIAVGLATNIPPHNLSEVIDGVCAYIKNPKISLSDFMKHIKGPDFPTGAVMIVGESLTQAYKTGKGKIILRAKINVESDGDKNNIVISELPYQVNKASLLQKIAELREAKKEELEYVGEILDESDRNGMRAVIKIKNGGNVNAVLEYLYKNTQLEVQYNINMVAIAGGKPKQMGIKEIVEYYVNYQREVLVRKSEYDLKNAQAREHIVEGLLIAINQIDLIISIIRKSNSVSEAKHSLMEKIKLTEIQAQAILDIRLARLVNLEILKLEQEYKDLQESIKHLKEILNSQDLQYKIIIEELKDIKKRFGNIRKTLITEEIEQKQPETSSAIKENKIVQPCVVSITADKKIKNLVIENEKIKIKSSENISNINDITTDRIECLSNTDLLIFTNLGNCLKLKAEEIPDIKINKKGLGIQDLNIKVEFNERPVKIIPASILSETENQGNFNKIGDKENLEHNIEKNRKEKTIIFYTKQGIIKKTLLKEYLISKQYYNALSIKDNDEVINVEVETDSDSLILISKKGYSLKIKSAEIPLQKRMASGVRAINLVDDCVIFAGQTEKSGSVTLVTNNGYAKKVPVGDYELMHRNRKGLKTITLKNNSSLIFAKYKIEPADLIIQSDKNFQVFQTSKIIYDNRISAGKNIIKGECNKIFEKI
ncbi:MAG: DNA topoisomerase 4 subunit A [Clostridia bacterium]|nr:DNA topoisomerase 4 subunit A [Clostridia bacterium]